MTDRYHKLIVTLDHPMRADDCFELVINRIKAMEYVSEVEGQVTTLGDYFAAECAPAKKRKRS